MAEIIALVPMRHHSQRVKGKNFRNLAGVPLFYYIIGTLQDCPEISRIVVDTDSEAIIAGLKKDFPLVTVIERTEALRADDMSMNEVLIYDTSKVKADFYLQTHSTNPLLKKETISKAITTFLSNYPVYDSLFSVTRFQTRLWDESGTAINHDPDILLQTQDLPPVFEENSCLYIFKRDTLLTHRNRLGDRPLMFEITASEAWDIDEILDFEIVEFLMNKEKLG